MTGSDTKLTRIQKLAEALEETMTAHRAHMDEVALEMRNADIEGRVADWTRIQNDYHQLAEELNQYEAALVSQYRQLNALRAKQAIRGGVDLVLENVNLDQIREAIDEMGDAAARVEDEGEYAHGMRALQEILLQAIEKKEGK